MVQRSDYEFAEEDMVVVEMIKSVAQGEKSYEELAEWFKGRSIPLKYKIRQ